MTLSIIAAMAENRVIGRNNGLPWKLPADLQRFKRLTMGHTLLMGRKTFESIGRPLPGRTMLVMTRQKDFTAEGVQVAHSLEEAVRMSSDQELFVAGGAQLYQQTLAECQRLYLTFIGAEFEGDAFFPKIHESQWLLVSEESHEPDEKNAYPYCFRIYERKSQGTKVEDRG
jgi:dihydrofolate reductase